MKKLALLLALAACGPSDAVEPQYDLFEAVCVDSVLSNPFYACPPPKVDTLTIIIPNPNPQP